MCDQVINEHFRRSLGQDYVNVFSTNKKNENEVITDNQTVVSKLSKDEKLEKNSTRHVSPSPLSGIYLIILVYIFIRLNYREFILKI